MEFVKLNDGQETAGATRGRLNLLKQKKTLETPCCLLPTSTGSVPHLTPDVLSDLKLSSEFSLSLAIETFLPLVSSSDSFKKDHRLKRQKTTGDSGDKFTQIFGSIHRYIGQPSALVIAGLRDPRQWIYSGNAQLPFNETGVATTTLAGGTLRVTPLEYAKAIQRLSPDIVISLGDCSVPDQGNVIKRGQRALDRTLKALDTLCETLSLSTMTENNTRIIATLMGGNDPALRKKCAVESLLRPKVSGVLVPLLASDSSSLKERLESSLSSVPRNIVRFVYGCQSPCDILEAVALGGDVFDGMYADALTSTGRALSISLSTPPAIPTLPLLNLLDSMYAQDFTPIHATCQCLTCTRHTRAYIHHLLNVKEMLAGVLLMVHNITAMDCFMAEIRKSLLDGTFDRLKKAFDDAYQDGFQGAFLVNE